VHRQTTQRPVVVGPAVADTACELAGLLAEGRVLGLPPPIEQMESARSLLDMPFHGRLRSPDTASALRKRRQFARAFAIAVRPARWTAGHAVGSHADPPTIECAWPVT